MKENADEKSAGAVKGDHPKARLVSDAGDSEQSIPGIHHRNQCHKS